MTDTLASSETCKVSYAHTGAQPKFAGDMQEIPRNLGEFIAQDFVIRSQEKMAARNFKFHIGRTDFLRIFIFGPPDFFADFVAGFFLLTFVGKKVSRKSSMKIPSKTLQSLYNKNPRHISAEGPGQ